MVPAAGTPPALAAAMAKAKASKSQWVAAPALEPVAGPQADSVEAGQGAPAADPRSPSGPDPATVDRIHEATRPRRRPARRRPAS